MVVGLRLYLKVLTEDNFLERSRKRREREGRDNPSWKGEEFQKAPKARREAKKGGKGSPFFCELKPSVGGGG